MKKRILVIDDDQGISEVIKIILLENNYEAEVISDSLDIHNRIQNIKPSMIFLDVWMQGIDGRDVVKKLKEDEKTKDIPVVLISALSNTTKIATESGANDFLAKPFDIEDLLKMVKKYT